MQYLLMVLAIIVGIIGAKLLISSPIIIQSLILILLGGVTTIVGVLVIWSGIIMK